MKFWNKRLKAMKEYIPGEQPQNLDEFIKLNTNENPFAPSKAVLEAIKAAANESLRRYPNPTAEDVRVAFAAANGLASENVFVANGSDEIFTLLFRGFIEPEGLAAFPYPSYGLYDTMAEMNGIAYEKVPLAGDFSYVMSSFLKKKYNLVIIASPNNPTGTVCPAKELASFLDRFKGLLVVDEAYVDFYGDSALGLVKNYDNLIVTRSFSKSYSLAGLRLGLAVASPELIQGFIRIKDSYNVDRLAIAGALAALKDTRGFRYNIEMVVNNKEYLEEQLAAIGFTVVPSKANFVFTKHPTVPAEKLYRELKEQKILVRFLPGPVQSEYIRVSVGTMMEMKTLITALKTITEV